MSAMVGTHQALSARNRPKRKPIRFKYAYSALLYAMHQKRIPRTDDGRRNFLIPFELNAEFDAWVEHDFSGDEDRFDAYRVSDC